MSDFASKKANLVGYVFLTSGPGNGDPGAQVDWSRGRSWASRGLWKTSEQILFDRASGHHMQEPTGELTSSGVERHSMKGQRMFNSKNSIGKVSAALLLIAGINGISVAASSAEEGSDVSLDTHITCLHEVPEGPVAALTVPSSADEERVGDHLAAQISDAISEGEALDETRRPVSGLPSGLAQGILGVVGDATTGFKVVVDPNVTSLEAVERRLNPRIAPDLHQWVEVIPSCNSSQALSQAWRTTTLDASILEDGGAGRYFDVATEQIVIEGLPAEAREIIAQRRGAEHVRFDELDPASRASRVDDSSPYKGGLRIKNATYGSCSGGFTVIRNGTSTRAMVTAGHCSPNGITWRNGPANDPVGVSAARSNYPDYDQMLLVNQSYSPKIFTNGNDTIDQRTVTNAADPAVGQGICSTGSFSHSMCGWTVRSVSAEYCDDAGCTTHVIRANKSDGSHLQGGDSGSPVYTRPASNAANIRGIVIAGTTSGTGNRVFWAERYLSIAGHLEVHALIGTP